MRKTTLTVCKSMCIRSYVFSGLHCYISCGRASNCLYVLVFFVYMYVCAVTVNICVCVYIQVCMYLSVCVFACICVCMCVYVCVYVCMCKSGWMLKQLYIYELCVCVAVCDNVVVTVVVAAQRREAVEIN